MKIHNNFVFIGLAILTVSSTIQSKSLDFEPSVRVLLSRNTQVVLGKGNDANYLPIAECKKSQDTVQLQCTVSVRLTDKSNDRCKLELTAGKDVTSIKIDSLYQLSAKKLIVVWSQLNSAAKDGLFARKITSVDIENCTNTVTLEFPEYKDDQQKLEKIVFYEDGFEAVVAGKYSDSTQQPQKFIFRHDLEGHEIEKLHNDNNPSKYEYDIKDVISFYKKKGEHKKQVITSARTNSQFNTVCSQKNEKDSRRFECMQIYVPNQSKNTEYVTLPENVKLIAVHNFRKGGFVLFGLESNVKLVAVEVRSGQQPKIQTYKLRWPVNKEVSTVFEFHEKIGSFTFAGEINEVEHSVVLQSFDLPDGNVHQDAQNIIISR